MPISKEKLEELERKLKDIGSELRTIIAEDATEAIAPAPSPAAPSASLEPRTPEEESEEATAAEEPAFADDAGIQERIATIRRLKDSETPEEREQLRALLFVLTGEIAEGGEKEARARYVLVQAGMM